MPPTMIDLIQYRWDEEAEIAFVLKEEFLPIEATSWSSENLLQGLSRGRLLNMQMRRARHIPGLVYAPVLLVSW